jgi:alpha/beta superfamily hydrolase
MEPVDVQVVHFESADGTRLEGDLLSPQNATGTAVVCHPHPLYGGTRNDAVVAALSRALVQTGHRVLRFDFRGTGGSDGEQTSGRAERDDLRAAIEAVEPGDGPLVVAGYSFGADIALSVDHPALARWIVVAPPLAIIDVDAMAAPTDPRPVHLLVGGHDQFKPADELTNAVATWSAADVHVFETADHFFGGYHGEITDLVAELLSH